MEPVLEYLSHALRKLPQWVLGYEVHCNRLQIASVLPEKVKSTVSEDRKFGLRSAAELLRLKEVPDKQLEIAQRLVHQKMTTPKLKTKYPVGCR